MIPCLILLFILVIFAIIFAFAVPRTHIFSFFFFTACTEFIVPVLGMLRSQIERESIKGIQDSYVIFSSVLRQRWPTLTTTSLPRHPTPITNLRTSSSMSTPLKLVHTNPKPPKAFKAKNKTQNAKKVKEIKVQVKETHSSAPIETLPPPPPPPLPQLVILDHRVAHLVHHPLSTDVDDDTCDTEHAEEVNEQDEEVPPHVSDALEASLNDLPDDEEEEDSQQEEEEEEDFDKFYNRFPHQIAYTAFKEHGTLPAIKKAVEERYPAWAANGYWLLTTGAHGGSKEIESVPTPDEAVGLLWAIGAVTAGKRLHNWPIIVPRDSLVKGAVECLRLLPPRRLSQGIMKYKNFGKQPRGYYKRSPPTKIDLETGINSANAIDVAVQQLPGTITPPALSAAMFSLGWLGGESYWVEHMEVLCARLPDAEYRKIKEVYNAIWALRASRHWTPHLALFEDNILAILEGFPANKMSARQVRHASYCAQGLVHLGYVPRRLFEVLAPLVVENFAWRGACSLCWALTIANELHSPLLPELLRALELRAPDVVDTGLPRRASASKIWQLFASLERMRPGYHFKKSWTPVMYRFADICEEDWKKLVHVETKMVSAVQRDVHRSMLSMGYLADLESTACGLSVDVAVPDEKLAVEVDGFAHFARNRPNQAVGNSLWKKRLLQAHGWLVVNVNVAEWARKRGAAEKRRFLKSSVIKEEEKRKERQAARLKKRKIWHKKRYNRGGAGAPPHPSAAFRKPKVTDS